MLMVGLMVSGELFATISTHPVGALPKNLRRGSHEVQLNWCTPQGSQQLNMDALEERRHEAHPSLFCGP